MVVTSVRSPMTSTVWSNILQNIFFCAQHKKQTYTGLDLKSQSGANIPSMYSSYASNIDSIPFHLGLNDSSSSSSSELTASSAESSFLTPGESCWTGIWHEWPLLCPFGSLFTALWRPGGGSAGGSHRSFAPPIRQQKMLRKTSPAVQSKFDYRKSPFCFGWDAWVDCSTD